MKAYVDKKTRFVVAVGNVAEPPTSARELEEVELDDRHARAALRDPRVGVLRLEGNRLVRDPVEKVRPARPPPTTPEPSPRRALEETARALDLEAFLRLPDRKRWELLFTLCLARHVAPERPPG